MLLDKHNKGPKCHIPARPMSFHPEEVQKLLPRSLAVPGLPPAPWGTAPATSEALPGVGSLATQDTSLRFTLRVFADTAALAVGGRGDPASASPSHPCAHTSAGRVRIDAAASHSIETVSLSLYLLRGLGSGASDVTAAIVLGQHDGARGRQRRT